MGTVPLTFQEEKVKNLLSPAVIPVNSNRGHLRRLNYNKTIFGRARTHTTLTDPESNQMWRDTSSPFSSLSPRRSPSELVYPHFLDQSYAPGVAAAAAVIGHNK